MHWHQQWENLSFLHKQNIKAWLSIVCDDRRSSSEIKKNQIVYSGTYVWLEEVVHYELMLLLSVNKYWEKKNEIINEWNGSKK